MQADVKRWNFFFNVPVTISAQRSGVAVPALQVSGPSDIDGDGGRRVIGVVGVVGGSKSSNSVVGVTGVVGVVGVVGVTGVVGVVGVTGQPSCSSVACRCDDVSHGGLKQHAGFVVAVGGRG